MSIIARYILRQHVGPFLFGSVTVLFLFVFQFILKHIDKLVGKGLDEWVIIQLILINIAWMVVLAVPMGVMFSTLLAFGSMSSAHEVTVVKASGGSLFVMMRPVVLMGLLLSVLLFWFNDYILPDANHRAKVLMNDIRRKKPTFSIESGQFSMDLEGYTILSRQVDSLSGEMRGVTIYDNSQRNRLNIVSADTGTVAFSEDQSKLVLNLKHGEIHQMVPNELSVYRIIDYEKYMIMIEASGFSFEESGEGMVTRGDREMHISDMRMIVNEAEAKAHSSDSLLQGVLLKHGEYLARGHIPDTVINEVTDSFKLSGKAVVQETVEKQKDSLFSDAQVLAELEKRLEFLKSSMSSHVYQKSDYGKRARQYEVEIQKKYAIPFACLIFVFVGCPLGILTKKGNFGISAAISLGFYMLYWVCLIGGEKFADRGMMSPMLSMWLGNIIIGVTGIILTIKVKNETISFPGSRLFKKIKDKFAE